MTNPNPTPTTEQLKQGYVALADWLDWYAGKITPEQYLEACERMDRVLEELAKREKEACERMDRVLEESAKREMAGD